jgi:hypothetical protein
MSGHKTEAADDMQALTVAKTDGYNFGLSPADKNRR